MLLNIPQCTRQSPITKNSVVKNADVEIYNVPENKGNMNVNHCDWIIHILCDLSIF